MEFLQLIKEGAGVISLVLTGIVWWLVKLNSDKIKANESAKQEVQHTKQEEIDTEVKKFEYLAKRVEFAEQHIITLHKKMTGMQRTINEYASRTHFAENNICLLIECKKRKPAIGTYQSTHKCKQQEGNEDERGL